MNKLGYSGKLLRETLGMAKSKRAVWLPPLMILLIGVAAVIIGSGAATR